MEYQEEKRICQNCKKDFVIEPEDFNFYEKIKVPPPTFCPDCRFLRRLTNLAELTLYNDICDKCGKNIISLFSPESSHTVFCSSCWWGDSWDALDYGRDYDFSKTFFEQFHDLRKIVPCQAINLKNCTDCKYSNGLDRCKNCISCTSGIQSINCFYCRTVIFSKDSIDSTFIVNTDHALECVNCSALYNTRFAYFSDECIDCSFLFNCLGCSDCFGCVNLRKKKYCIFNKQYSKEEYKKEILKWDLRSYETLLKAKEKFLELYYKIPRKFALLLKTENVLGDDIQNTKNCHYCFSATHGVENCKFIFHGGLLLKDSHDTTLGGNKSGLLYQTTGSTTCERTKFTMSSTEAIDVEYSENIYYSSNCFGCAKLRHKKYCILNKQYTKEKYEELIPKIKKHMKEMPYKDKEGRIYKYGDYFPFEHSMWAYNESWGQLWFPLTKKEALEKGFFWRDHPDRNYKITIQSEDLPDKIENVPDSIINEVISCEHTTLKENGKFEENCKDNCTGAFRILPNELTFLRSMKVALPRLCPNCRCFERLRKINIPKLFHRKCMCGGTESENRKYQNTIEHFHGIKPCQNEFETAISPEREEIVYCKECYQAEFI